MAKKPTDAEVAFIEEAIAYHKVTCPVRCSACRAAEIMQGIINENRRLTAAAQGIVP